jgi:hypothetical protein
MEKESPLSGLLFQVWRGGWAGWGNRCKWRLCCLPVQQPFLGLGELFVIDRS